MNVDKINKRAARGARLLDEKRPGWHKVVSAETLDIQNLYDCVLGQQDGYNDMIEEFFGHIEYSDQRREYTRHGFDLPEKAYAKYDMDDRFRVLTAAWRREITERRISDEYQN